MANKYAELNAKAILLNDGQSQLLPVSKAKLIELANDQKGQFGKDVVDVAGALSYLLGQDATNLEAAKSYTYTSIAALDSVITADTGYVLSGITEVDGKLTSYAQTWLDASVITYNGDSHVDTALTDIYKQLAAISGGGTGSIQQQITKAIEALDKAEVKEQGKAIVSVSETDGIISAAVGNVDAKYVDVNNANDKFKTGGDKTTLTAQETLEHLQGEIEAVEAAAAKYTIDEVTTDVPETVAHRYQLSETIGGKKSQAGKFIDIPKDSSLKEVYLGFKDDTVDETSGKVTQNGTGDAQSLNFVYHLENGKYSLVKIDVSKFLTQSEFENGLQVDSNGVVSVKRDDESEGFLTVGSAGIKLSGVQSAIDAAKGEAKTYTGTLIEALDSVISAKEENGFSYVMTGVTETDGMLTAASYIGLSDVTVKTTPFTGENLAALLGNENLPSNLHEALNKIAGKVSAGAANAVTDVKGSEGTYVKVTATKSNNTVTLTVDDSALGNVAALKYDVLASDIESVTILG